MEIVIVAYDDEGKYLAERRANSIQEAQDFLSSLVIDKDTELLSEPYR